MKDIQIAAGSVRGAEHVRTGRNNQDSHHIAHLDRLLVGVVCDGCGSGQHSEVGAKLGSRFVGEALVRCLVSIAEHELQPADINMILSNVRLNVAAQIRTIASAMGTPEAITPIIAEYFLFTCVGFFVTPRQCVVFSLGDGICAVNGAIRKFEPMEGNRPQYLGYNAIDHEACGISDEALRFKVHEVLRAENLQSVLVGTDGFQGLTKLEKAMIPGRDETVGPISQFWENDAFFRNPDMIRRRLAIINGEQRPGRVGLLQDDATVVVARRIRPTEGER